MRKKSRPQISGTPMWMNIYANIIMLVLMFFVVMYTFSVVDADKFQKFARSFANYSGANIDDSLSKTETEAFQQIQVELEQYFQNNQLDDIFVQRKDNGIIISFTNDILFDFGSANIRLDMQKILLDMGEILQRSRENIGQVQIAGHTDNIQINIPGFIDNWDISAERAIAINRFFIEQSNIEPQILTASGYAEFHPVADNDTEEGRAKNRRIEIFVKTAGNAN